MGDILEFPGNLNEPKSSTLEFPKNLNGSKNSSKEQKELVTSSLRLQVLGKAYIDLIKAAIEKDDAGRKLLEAQNALDCGSIDGISYSPLEVELIIKQCKVEFNKASEKFEKFKHICKKRLH